MLDDSLNIDVSDIALDIDDILNNFSFTDANAPAFSKHTSENDEVDINNAFDLHISDDYLHSSSDLVKELVEDASTLEENIKSLDVDNNAGDPIISADTDLFEIKFSQAESILDDSDRKKIIKASERQIRSSFEYSKYLGFLKNEMNMVRCSFFSKIDADRATIEMHHYPFTLFELCDIVMSKQLADGKRVTTFSITNEVLKLHYAHLVGLVPLSVTVHQLAHAGKIFINIAQVFGNVAEFLTRYREHIDPELLMKLAKVIYLSQKNAAPIEDDQTMRLQVKDPDREVTELSIVELNHLESLVPRQSEEDEE